LIHIGEFSVKKRFPSIHYLGLIAVLLLTACAGAVPAEQAAFTEADGEAVAEGQDYQIITLLPQDAIPAIDEPVFQSAEEAEGEYDPDDLVIGVSYNGDSRAYSVGLLSSHEIVNDTVGGIKIAITW
jgi:hypothetical protein